MRKRASFVARSNFITEKKKNYKESLAVYARSVC